MSPFDKARYERLLEGLEIAEVRISGLEFTGRIDSEYYRPSHLRAENLVTERGAKPLASLCNFIIGPFGSAFTVENYTDDNTYRYIRGKDVKPMQLAESDKVYMPKADFERLSRYALQAGDVLVSVVGTLGNAALVEKRHLPAIFSCKSTALRTNDIEPRYLVTYLNCKYGHDLLIRKERGAVQKGLNLDDLRLLGVYVAGTSFQSAIVKATEKSEAERLLSQLKLHEAESSLLQSLGLNAWTPPEALSYVRSSSQAFAAGRLDAQFFAPRVEQLLARLARDGLRLADVAPARHERFEPTGSGDFDYIEIGSLGADGTAASESVPMAEAPSRATQYVRTGDVITSTVRPIRRLSALVAPEQDGAVCSSGFVVLQPQGISGEVLLTYLRLPLVCELMDLHTSATMYPAISESDLLALPIPAISPDVQAQVQDAVRQSAHARHRATRLLDAAKRAVEIAIEEGEPAALRHLQDVL